MITRITNGRNGVLNGVPKRTSDDPLLIPSRQLPFDTIKKRGKNETGYLAESGPGRFVWFILRFFCGSFSSYGSKESFPQALLILGEYTLKGTDLPLGSPGPALNF